MNQWMYKWFCGKAEGGCVGAKPPMGYLGQLKSCTPISLTQIAPKMLAHNFFKFKLRLQLQWLLA